MTRDPDATRAHLVQAAVDSLVDIGYSRTTGVEVCRRAGVTRGALNHHFPEFADLLIAALHRAYAHLLTPGQEDSTDTGLDAWVRGAHQRSSAPEFKAVIELWLAARNDPELGRQLTDAIGAASAMFRPERITGDPDPERERYYRTAMEALIGLALGRAFLGSAVGHEQQTVDFLADVGRALDQGTLGPALDSTTSTGEHR